MQAINRNGSDLTMLWFYKRCSKNENNKTKQGFLRFFSIFLASHPTDSLFRFSDIFYNFKCVWAELIDQSLTDRQSCEPEWSRETSLTNHFDSSIELCANSMNEVKVNWDNVWEFRSSRDVMIHKVFIGFRQSLSSRDQFIISMWKNQLFMRTAFIFFVDFIISI